ncbi:MAG: hypothetical protein J6Z11_12070, partial [Candidatus Riflebacteria bacterium]|nr:hypothetical protein [Candidatus Riflebacteria bacterium]
MAKLSSEKYNILLIILIFIIPLISLDISFGLISKINNDLEEKKQENEAVQEAETLAAEGNFSTEFGIHFREFFDVIQNVEKLDIKNNSFLPTHLKQSSDKIFENPFPKYNLYVFKIPNKTKQAELIFYEGSISTGKRILCKTFEHLYNLNNDIEDKANDNIAKTLLGKFTNITAIAKEMRGIATNSNGIHKASWFIWDYVNIGQEGIYGAFLLCEEIEDQAKHGRLLALKRLKFRGKTIGAFIPVYNGYGEADIQYPLEKSKLFKDWADSLTIKNIDELDHWLMNFLPQNHKLGNYSAFCHLERNSSHIAVVLVKSKKVFYAPKWIVVINFIVLFSLLVILYSGISFGIWPQLKLRTRFILSYALASIVPLSLLSVIAYAYLLEYENTSEELEKNNLQLTLKDLDSYKLTNIREYKTTFNKVINDPKLKELIKINGVKSELVTDYVVSIFQNDDPDTNLPILGAKIYNEIGEGAFSNVTASNSKDVKKLINSLDSVHIDILRDEILKENPGLKLKDYNRNEENDLAKNAFSALTGRELKDDMNNHFSLPIPRKNGDFCGYHIFDKIKIDGKTKYLLLVLWDDKKLDERIIKNAINNNSLKKKNQSFIAYKINGQKLDPVGKKARADEDLLNKIEEKAKQSSYFKKTNTFIYKDNLIVIMPALNFNQTIFVGWVNKIHIISDLFDRKITFTILILISIFTIWICSIRSSSVFLKPITLLKNALDEVSLGNLNIGFIDNPNNELGKVSNEFGKMIEELREK